jgi:outer membrane protein assembly factor BamE
MLKPLISILCAACLGLLAGCGIHRVDVQQGNVVDEAMLKQLHTGMNRRQVKFVLGTPLLEDPFHANRWDYIYMYSKDGVLKDKRHLTLFFSDDKLAKIVTVPESPKAWEKSPDVPDEPPPAEPGESGGDSDSD